MSNAPLMPKATAVWLVDNTALTFDQVADFTKMHPLEVRAIADGDAAQGIKGMDPISTGQLTRDEIEKGEKDPNYRLKLGESKVALPPAAKKKGPRYTPVSRRHERPSAILWLVRNHPELKDAQIMRLVGTTKTTIASVRDRTHWNASTLTPMDPVTLGLCSQIELDFEVQRAAKEKPVARGLRRRHPAAGLRDHQEGAGIRADRKAARRPQRRRRVRQAEDDRRQEGGRRGVRRFSFRSRDFERGGATCRVFVWGWRAGCASRTSIPLVIARQLEGLSPASIDPSICRAMDSGPGQAAHPGMTIVDVWHLDRKIQLRDLAARCCPSFARISLPSPIRGRREDRVRAAPAVSCAMCTKSAHTSIQVQRRASGFPAQWLYGL